MSWPVRITILRSSISFWYDRSAEIQFTSEPSLKVYFDVNNQKRLIKTYWFLKCVQEPNKDSIQISYQAFEDIVGASSFERVKIRPKNPEDCLEIYNALKPLCLRGDSIIKEIMHNSTRIKRKREILSVSALERKRNSLSKRVRTGLLKPRPLSSKAIVVAEKDYPASEQSSSALDDKENIGHSEMNGFITSPSTSTSSRFESSVDPSREAKEFAISMGRHLSQTFPKVIASGKATYVDEEICGDCNDQLLSSSVLSDDAEVASVVALGPPILLESDESNEIWLDPPRSDLQIFNPLNYRSIEKGTHSWLGLENVGNSCFMNAVLQTTLHVDPFSSNFVNFYARSEGLNMHDCKDRFSLIFALAKFVACRRYICVDERISQLKRIKKSVNNEHYGEKFEEDANEFLIHFLGEIRTCFNELKEMVDFKAIVNPVSSVFGFEIDDLINCSSCGQTYMINQRKSEDLCLFLHMPSQIESSISIECLLNAYFDKEPIDRTCTNCASVKCTIFRHFKRLPSCIILVLKRYEFARSDTQTIKRTDSVKPCMQFCLEESLCSAGVCFDRFEDNDVSEENMETQFAKSNLSSTSPQLSNRPCQDVDVNDQLQLDVVKGECNNFHISSTSLGENIDPTTLSSPFFEREDNEEQKLLDSLVQPYSVSSSQIGNSNKEFLCSYQPLSASSVEILSECCDSLRSLNLRNTFKAPSKSFRTNACRVFGVDRWTNTGAYHLSSNSFKGSRPYDPLLVANVKADGNCLFRSLSFLISGGSEDQYAKVRESIVKFERQFADQVRLITGLGSDDWEKYIEEMSLDGTWGTTTELLVVASILNVEVYTFYGGRWIAYRPIFRTDSSGNFRQVNINCYEYGRRQCIFFMNHDLHFSPVLSVLLPSSTRNYHLTSVISHYGLSSHRGHYVSDISNPSKQNWLHCDDEWVNEISCDDMIKDCCKAGYIYFYSTSVAMRKEL